MRTLSSIRLLVNACSKSSALNGLKPSAYRNTLQNSTTLLSCSSLNPQTRFLRTSAAFLSSSDYYKVLGVSRDATAKDIKKAYYQLAKKYHPDTNKGNKETQKKFQEVSEAYECLSDDSKRKQYDAYGTSDGGGGGNPFGEGFPGASAGGWNFKSNIDPEELFRTIFGDKTWRGGAGGFNDAQFDFGQPTEYKMKISFLEAAQGVEKEISVNIMDNCQTCRGSGNEPGTSTEKCVQCSGTGMETVTTGPFMMRSTCRRCHGKGFANRHPCKECGGVGQTKQRHKVRVPVPAGIEDGQTVRMTVGSGRKEIYITFQVAPSDYFRRQGPDVHTDAKISLAQAALGGAVRVQGVHEDLTIQIPSCTSSHTRMRMAGKGIKKVSGYGYGDHYIHIRIDPPKDLSEKQRALLQAFAESENNTPGTINGLTYTKQGGKVVLEDPEGLVGEIRDLLSDDRVSNKDKN